MKKRDELDIYLISIGLISIRKQTKLFFLPFIGWIIIDIIAFYNLIKIKYKFWQLVILYGIVIGITAPIYIILTGKYPQENIFINVLYYNLPAIVIGILLYIVSFLYQKKRLFEYYMCHGVNTP